MTKQNLKPAKLWGLLMKWGVEIQQHHYNALDFLSLKDSCFKAAQMQW